MTRCLSFLLVLSWLLLPNTFVNSQSENTSVESELDQWRGCSLGVRIERKDGKVFVSKVRDYAADNTPLKAGDQLAKVEDIEITTDTLSELSKLLNKTSPDQTLKTEIVRDGERN